MWTEFREQLIKERGLKCELYGVKVSKKTAQIHHLRPDLYDLLDPKLFKILSPKAHDFVEHIALILSGKAVVPNREALIAWAGEFLPKIERKYGA